MRITAYNLPLVAVVLAVLKKYIITEIFKKAHRVVNTPYHGFHFLEGKGGYLIAVIDTPPGIEMLIGRSNGAEAGLHAVRNAGQGAIVQKVRYIAPIAGIDLFPGGIDRRVFVCWILELHDAEGHAVDIEQNVRSAVYSLAIVGVFDGKLIDGTEDIVIGISEINQGNHVGGSALWRELDAVYHPAIGLVQYREIALRADQANGLHDLPDFIDYQIWIRLTQKLFQIVDIQHIPLGGACYAVAG